MHQGHRPATQADVDALSAELQRLHDKLDVVSHALVANAQEQAALARRVLAALEPPAVDVRQQTAALTRDCVPGTH